MNRDSLNFYSILVLLFFFWFSIFPAYPYFSTLDVLDPYSLSSSLENIEEEDSISHLDKKERVGGSTFFIKAMFINYLSLMESLNPFFQLQTSDEKHLILRC